MTIARFSFGLALAISFCVVACSGNDSSSDTGVPIAPPNASAPVGDGSAKGDANVSKDAATDSKADAAASDANVSKDAATDSKADTAASCTPVFVDGSNCSTCIQTGCSTSLTACNGDCECLAFNACSADCIMKFPADFAAINTCMDVCKAAHPAGNTKFLVLATCVYDKCSATDGGSGACS